MLKEAVTTRSSRSQMLFEIGVLKNFANKVADLKVY